MSRVSLAAARDRLDTLTRSLDEGALRALSADLAAVAQLLGEEYALRRAIAEPGASPDKRAGLLTRVLGDRVGESARDLLSGVVRERWSKPADLVGAVGSLAAEATLALAETGGGLDAVEDELFRFARVVAGDARLSLALSSPALPLDRKHAIVRKLLEGKARPETLALVEQAVADSGGRALDRRLEALVRLAAERRQRLVAVVTAATPLTGEQSERLKAALARSYGKDVQLQVELDPSIIGGLVVSLGDEVLDGSVSHRLELARRTVNS
ncbi:MAG TPA: F0F1 ATP synthase subunit delta [Mycobacteriales bacterium]|nr:F0F1 ATP synthase subunit delta [Mycobacteriales bacterium]